jgi:hypothetical protein
MRRKSVHEKLVKKCDAELTSMPFGGGNSLDLLICQLQHQ